MTQTKCKPSYSALAECYEYLLSYCDYEEWSQYVLQCLKDYGAGNEGIDGACGSGYFTRALCKNGYSVTGVDISTEMLSEAKELSIKENLDISFIKQDITCLKSFKKVDFVTVINDGLNYVDKSSVNKTFKNVYKVLNNGGLFLFDISSEYKLRTVIGDNMFGEDDEDVSYLWFNKLEGDQVKMDLTFFKRKGDVYVKQEESHVQYIHTQKEIEDALSECGFTILKVCALYGKEITATTERLVFIARKGK